MRKWWWPIIYLSEWISYKLADGLFFISEAEIEPAIKSFQLDEAKCFLLPYGTNKLNDEPELTETVEEPSKERRIIFFGPLSYQPNLEALNTILYQIEPTLRSLSSDISYKFIICGGGLPEGFTISKSPFVSYLGYVQDIESMVRSSHIMINPITTGGGVKTKVIESIAWGTSVLSSRSGAMGIDSESCGAKLIQVEDNDYVGYAKEILRLLQEPKQPTPAIFYKKYFWGNIVEQFMIDLQSILTKNNL
jgi:glycosyltransferase involved in cell wall biosynthesis